MKPKNDLPTILERSRPLQVGFVPDADCAPVVVAHESGLFAKYELRVELQRETRWASIRDKLVHGELDAAHAPATLPFIINLGVDSDRCACVAGMVLSLQGNAITISSGLWKKGVRDAAGLRDVIYQDWGRRTYTFGVVSPYSPPLFLLRQWLKTGGIVPGHEVRIVVIPPAQMFPTLKLGYIDGYCAGEPWSCLAAEAGVGHRVATSSELAPLHPEKVLLARSDFAHDRATEHERLIAALLEACAFCEHPKNAALLGGMLSRPQYVNAPAECFGPGLSGGSPPPADSLAETSGGLNVFHRHNANEPGDEKAEWIIHWLYELMDESPLKMPRPDRAPVLKNIFRRDIFERAKAVFREQTKMLEVEAERYRAGIRG